MKFKVGDRVRVWGRFSYTDGSRGVVKKLKADGERMRVDLLDGPGELDYVYVYPQQCRRLRKKSKAPRGKVGGAVIYVMRVDSKFTGSIKHVTSKRVDSLDVKFIEAEDQCE